MEITEIRVYPVDEDKLKAYASIVFDDCFIVNDLKVILGTKGLFLSMPSRRRKRGGYRDVAHPLNNETRDRIEAGVIEEYHRCVEGTASDKGQDRVAAAMDRAPAHPAFGAATAAPAALGAEPAGPLSTSEDGDGERADPPVDRPSLEEVEQEHLSDSFWSVS
jgi:stage V sporulation protein G